MNFSTQTPAPDLIPRLFASERECRRFLFKKKWPNGFCCPLCERTRALEIRGGRFWICSRRGCSYSESATVRTVFEATKKPLRLWFQAIWILASVPGGISAKELQRKLGLGSYQTAWTWLHKLRTSLQRRECWVSPLNSGITSPSIPEKTEQHGLSPSTLGRHAWRAGSPNMRSALAFLRSSGNAPSSQRDHQDFIAWVLSSFGGRVSYKHLPKYRAEHQLWTNFSQPPDRIEAILNSLSLRAISYWRLLGKASPNHSLQAQIAMSPGSPC